MYRYLIPLVVHPSSELPNCFAIPSTSRFWQRSQPHQPHRWRTAFFFTFASLLARRSNSSSLARSLARSLADCQLRRYEEHREGNGGSAASSASPLHRNGRHEARRAPLPCRLRRIAPRRLRRRSSLCGTFAFSPSRPFDPRLPPCVNSNGKRRSPLISGPRSSFFRVG